MGESLDDILTEFGVTMRRHVVAKNQLDLIEETKKVITAIRRSSTKNFQVDKEISKLCLKGLFYKSRVLLEQNPKNKLEYTFEVMDEEKPSRIDNRFFNI